MALNKIKMSPNRTVDKDLKKVEFLEMLEHQTSSSFWKCSRYDVVYLSHESLKVQIQKGRMICITVSENRTYIFIQTLQEVLRLLLQNSVQLPPMTPR